MINLLQAIAGKAYDRGIMDEAAGRAFVQRLKVAHGVSTASVGKVKVKSKRSSNSLLFPQYFHPPGPIFLNDQGDCFAISLQGCGARPSFLVVLAPMRHWLIVLCVLRVVVLVPLLVQGGMLELLCLIYLDTIFLHFCLCVRSSGR